MKKILLLLAVIIGATACNFTEEIYFNKDGSGKLNIHFTGEELVDMMSEMDSTAKAQAIDTTFVFKEFFKEKKDSLAQLPKAEQERLKKLEPFTMRMVVDQKEGLLAFDMSSEFKAIAEIDDAFNAFQDAAAIGPSVGNATMEKPKEPSPTRVNYYYKNHRFKRTTTIVDQELFQQSLDSLKGSAMFLSNSTYTFKYHFPKKVKKVNVTGATFSLDGKTMTYTVSFLDMMKDPTATNLEVVLEK